MRYESMKIYQMPEMASVARLQQLAEAGRDHQDWYFKAAEDIVLVCRDQGWDASRFIDVLALTSPRTSVRRNIRVAMSYMRDRSLPTDVIAATRAALAHYEATGVIRGLKTSEFAKALRGDLNAIVLDTWMAVAMQVDQNLYSRVWVQRYAKEQVRFVADLLGVMPAQAQAMIWAGTVREVGRNVPILCVSDELTYEMES
jgi:hypothetical protein